MRGAFSHSLHLNIYGNQAGRMELNSYFNSKVGEKWETTLLVHGKNQSFENFIPIKRDIRSCVI